MINYAAELNPAQLEAVNALEGPVLVIAGAGSGKTRTIVYRLARLVESGAPASSILLLTFTRKAAQEMLDRARLLLAQHGSGAFTGPGGFWVQGGTFHSFAYSVLRLFKPDGFHREPTVLDTGDALSLLQICRSEALAGKVDRSFPKDQTTMAILSKSRNREQDMEDTLRREFVHLLPHAEAIRLMAAHYAELKRSRCLMDYDDLLFALEDLLRCRAEALDYCRGRYRYLMLDEFQDTNMVQSRLAALLAGADPGAPGAVPGSGNIMAVGDDAQSIYAFRGANVRNILNFPDTYPGARLIRLEENYRSTQPVLNLCNAILDQAAAGFKKRLFTRRSGEAAPQVLRPFSDLSQGELVAAKVLELLRLYPPGEIAVLFRAGYQSYHTEAQLNKLGLRFRKYGGLRYTDAAHIKDALAFVRLLLNPLDFTAFRRITDFIRGIGGKTSLKLHQAMQEGESAVLDKACAKYPELKTHLDFLEHLRTAALPPCRTLEEIIDHYQPTLEARYPDDYPGRRPGLEELAQIAVNYDQLDMFAADFSLDEPLVKEEERGDTVTLSTIHSAKGLEWGAVLVLDLVEDRFPSRHARMHEDYFEEERRLMYVACTRAKDYLGLFVPASLYERSKGGRMPVSPSIFVRELSPALYEEWREDYGGGLRPEPAPSRLASVATFSRTMADALVPPDRPRFTASPSAPAPQPPATPAGLGYCQHRTFGRGKLVRFMPPDKYQVHFPGMGLKVIMASYLEMEKN
ncbi:MAG: ATP-dependent helicase [Deltaproteobacteria bacterium]|jgi:DNA helicase-2/ATP-dependent DNA helicase PcrA|nr:ATP-dependent helicase [Deltaproteobacteria bacterium]